MGANQSNLNPTSSNDSDVALSAKLASRHGFQILRVHPNSPVSEAHVQAYFDFIISINGVEVSPDIPNIIGEMARNHVNKPLKLTIYNSRQDEEREVTIVPRTGWGGEGLLGCAIRFSPLEGVRDRVWHILKVFDNSPAHKAGLIADEDYVIACPDLLLRSEDEFYQLITQNTRRPVKLVVFNVNRDELREIVIVPDFEWGGEGCLGCDVGSGMVHWIPKKSTITGASKPNASVPLIPNLPVTDPVNETSTLSTNPTAPSPVPSTSFLQAQYQSHPQSQTASPLKADTNINFNLNSNANANANLNVNVNIPHSRPVIDNLGGGYMQSSTAAPTNTFYVDPSAIDTTNVPPPPITQYIHNHPQPKQPVAGPVPPVEVIDDIPIPKFTVPSDIINQN